MRDLVRATVSAPATLGDGTGGARGKVRGDLSSVTVGCHTTAGDDGSGSEATSQNPNDVSMAQLAFGSSRSAWALPEAMDAETYAQILDFLGRPLDSDLEACQEATGSSRTAATRGTQASASADAEELMGSMGSFCSGDSCASTDDASEDSDWSVGKTGSMSGPRKSRTATHYFEEALTPPQKSMSPVVAGKRFADRLKSDCQMICRNVENDFTEIELMLRRDLAANKLRWYGVWSRDLWCFLRNNNPVCSLCYSHYLHPISRKNRIVAMLLQVLFLLFVAAALTEARMCVACGFQDCSPDHHPVDCVIETQDGNRTIMWQPRDDPREMQAWGEFLLPLPRPDHEKLVKLRREKVENLRKDPALNFCCLCDRVFVNWFFKFFGPTGGVIYAIITNCAFALTVFPLMMCACVQHNSPRFRKLGEVIGYVVVAGLAAVMLLRTPFLMRYVMRNNLLDEFMVNLVIGKLGSWTFVTLINITFFSFAWRLQGGAVDLSAMGVGGTRLPRENDLSPPQPELEDAGVEEEGAGGDDRQGRRQRLRHHVTAEDYCKYVSAEFETLNPSGSSIAAPSSDD